MKLLAASCRMPAKTCAMPGKVYGVTRARAADTAVAMDYLAPAVEHTLAQAKCAATDLDLIVSLSWSPDHLVADTRIMGPRIGHPLQKKIGAHHAFVFDLMDASLAKALHIVNQFALAQSVKRVLLVRADSSQGLQADPESGFAIPDGAFALLLEPDAQQHFFSTPVINPSGTAAFHPLRVELNTHVTHATDTKGTLRFPVQPALVGAIDRAVQTLSDTAGFATSHCMREHWLTHAPERPHCLGPFDLAFQLEMLLEYQREPMLAISIDPFGLVAEGVTLKVTGVSNA